MKRQKIKVKPFKIASIAAAAVKQTHYCRRCRAHEIEQTVRGHKFHCHFEQPHNSKGELTPEMECKMGCKLIATQQGKQRDYRYQLILAEQQLEQQAIPEVKAEPHPVSAAAAVEMPTSSGSGQLVSQPHVPGFRCYTARAQMIEGIVDTLRAILANTIDTRGEEFSDACLCAILRDHDLDINVAAERIKSAIKLFNPTYPWDGDENV